MHSAFGPIFHLHFSTIRSCLVDVTGLRKTSVQRFYPMVSSVYSRRIQIVTDNRDNMFEGNMFLDVFRISPGVFKPYLFLPIYPRTALKFHSIDVYSIQMSISTYEKLGSFDESLPFSFLLSSFLLFSFTKIQRTAHYSRVLLRSIVIYNRYRCYNNSLGSLNEICSFTEKRYRVRWYAFRFDEPNDLLLNCFFFFFCRILINIAAVRDLSNIVLLYRRTCGCFNAVDHN